MLFHLRNCHKARGIRGPIETIKKTAISRGACRGHKARGIRGPIETTPRGLCHTSPQPRHKARGIRGPIETGEERSSPDLKFIVTKRAEFAALLRRFLTLQFLGAEVMSQSARNSRPY